MKHFHWNFIAYDVIGEKGEFQGGVEVSVVGYPSEEIALEAAKNMLKRPNYYLRKVWECTECQYQKDVLEQLKKFQGHD